MPATYDAARYWEERLATHASLRGTGHLSYSESYNRWLYRAKGTALRRALPPLQPPSLALDVGSGVGWVVDQLLRRGMSVEGCDISPTAVRLLSESFPGLTFFTTSIGTDPVPRPDASYDLVTALDVTYHITDDEVWEAAVHELARVTKPGGSVVVLDAFGDTERVPADHVRFRTRRRWNDASHRAGLRVETVVPAYRWLSRDVSASVFRRLPGSARGMCEFVLERAAPRPPHMRCVRFSRT